MNNNLKAEIARGDWTVAGLAKAAGMSAASLSQKIRGKRDFKRAEMYALRRALDCTEIPLEELFEEAEEEA